MNLKKFYLKALVALVSLCFVSCSDDDTVSTDVIYLPSTIVNKSLVEGNESMSTLYFRYDKESRLTYIIQAAGKAAPENGDTLSFSYDNQGRLSFVVAGDTTRFTYNGDKVFCTQMYNDEYYRDTLEVGSKGELLKLYNTDQIYTYEYDVKGNLIKYTGKGTDESMAYISTLTYDGKNGLFKNIKTPSWYFIREQGFPLCFINNTLQEVHGDGCVDLFTCDYNDAGYPSNVEVNGNSKFLLTIEYVLVKK